MQEPILGIKVKDEGTEQERHWLLKCHGNERIVEIPEGVDVIACKAFEACNGAEEIQLPKTVKSICARAFHGCDSLKRILILREGGVGLSGEAFNGTPTGLEIVFAGTSETWKKCIEPTTVVSHSYDNGWGGGAPGVYTYETTYYPMEHSLREKFVCHVRCIGDGVELVVTGERRCGGIQEVDSPYNR